jgi:DNA-binding YbaB/EbfC family protein
MMEQARKMQEQLAAAQDALATQEFEGSAGGGVVRARVTGAGKVVSVDIDPSVIDPEDPELLADLVVAAVGQAQALAEQAAQSQLGDVTGGLDGVFD